MDLDAPPSVWGERVDAVPPSMVLVNPDSGHAHVWYELAHPVVLKGEASPGQALLPVVEALLEAFLGADPAYAGLLARNPFRHPRE
ncbi:replication initiation protein, partial [Acinetobacter baumannii]